MDVLNTRNSRLSNTHTHTHTPHAHRTHTEDNIHEHGRKPARNFDVTLPRSLSSAWVSVSQDTYLKFADVGVDALDGQVDHDISPA